MSDYAGMNAIWDAWVPAGEAPARATVQARLANAAYRVEIQIVAVSRLDAAPMPLSSAAQAVVAASSRRDAVTATAPCDARCR